MLRKLGFSGLTLGVLALAGAAIGAETPQPNAVEDYESAEPKKAPSDADAQQAPAAACAQHTTAAAQSCCDEASCTKACEDQAVCGSSADGLLSDGRPFKDMPLDFLNGLDFLDGSTLSFGGQLRYRYMDEKNRIRPGGPGTSTYDLWRWRNHLDFKVGDRFRLYVEMLDASQFGEDLPVTGIDVNRWNLHNFYADFGLFLRDDKPAFFRAGRQELFYGSQQLVTPLDWSNTRRNFEGFKFSSPGEVWDIDLFATRPVNTATFLNPVAVGHNPVTYYRNKRDEADDTRWFSGIYTVYRGMENNTFDLYWLWLDTDNAFDAVVGAGSVGGDRHTVGLRWQTSDTILDECCQPSQVWTMELEGAYQFGKDARTIADTTARRDVQAGFFTAKAGVTLPQVAWKPTLKGVYYWGSGDKDAADGTDNTFSQLFPLGHAYWGIIDNVSGQNLNDWSIQLGADPTDKLKLLGAMHWFDLATSGDVLYNVAGVPFGTPGSSRNIGSEFDLIGTYTFSPDFSLQIGYLWFWNGTFIDQNIPRDDATQLYVQATLKY